MIRLSFANINQLTQMHYEAVRSYVENIMSVENRKTLYSCIIALHGFEMYDIDYDEQRDTFTRRNSSCWQIAIYWNIG